MTSGGNSLSDFPKNELTMLWSLKVNREPKVCCQSFTRGKKLKLQIL